MEPGGPLASCEQKLFSSKNVSNPFVLFKLKGKEGRGKGSSCTTGSSCLQSLSLKSNPFNALF